MKRLIIVDGNAPWVRSLFLAMPAGIDVRFLRVGNPGVFKKISDKPWWSARQWHRIGDRAFERWIIIPGWGKAPKASLWLTKRAVNQAIAGETDSAVVFTLPQYASVAESMRSRPTIYYAHDPFEFYEWDQRHTRELENRMLQTATVTFAISRVLRDDLAARTQQPVLYSPNALSSDFITAMRPGQSFVPAELLNLPRPIVGCTGQINETYDWAMLGELADRMPEASFVFIGPIIAEAAEHRTAIDAVLKGKPNVHWLGRKPHADLPAYLGAFDVCLNPLAPGPHADRRSPLRLFDYLATGKPIVSTNIAEARHDGHVWLADNATEMAALIRQGYSGERQLDLPARQKYIEQNTWEMRALDMLAKIESSTKIRMTKFE